MMKHANMKYTRWQSGLLIRLLCLPAALLLFVLSAQAQDRIAPVGGPGGGEFVARCPPGQLLGGVELRVGDDVDAIRPLCRKPSVEAKNVKVGSHYNVSGQMVPEHYESVTTYYVSDATATTGWYGGPGGGSIKTLVCSPGAGGIDDAVVSAIYVEAEGVDTVIVNHITLLCEGATGGAATQLRDRKFWKDISSNDRTVKNFEAPKNSANEIRGTSICPVSRDNFATVAVGIHGRSGKWLDAVGLICDEPKLPPKPVSSIGRVKVPPPVGSIGRVKGPPTSPSDPAVSICERARQARARNSPAAPNLEAQCRATYVPKQSVPRQRPPVAPR